MEYLNIVFGFIILVLSSFSKFKNKSKITLAGWGIIIMGIAVVGVSFIQKCSNDNELKLRPYEFSLNSLHFTIIAEYTDPNISDSLFINSIPNEITVPYAYIGNYAIRLDLKRVESVYRPVGYRSTFRPSVTYYSINLRKNYLERDPISPYKYIWDLNGQTITLNIPQSSFKILSEKGKWIYTVEFIVGDKIIREELKDNSKWKYEIKGFEKNRIYN